MASPCVEMKRDRRGSGHGILDDGATEADVAVVEHDRLTGRHCTLGLVKMHETAITIDFNAAHLIRLAVANLGGTAEAGIGGRPVYPAQIARVQSGRQKQRVIAALN